MKTLLIQCTPMFAVADETYPEYNSGADPGKTVFYLTPEENLEPATEGEKIEVLAELPDMNTWQIKAINDILKQL